jgi:hypothetical protein
LQKQTMTFNRRKFTVATVAVMLAGFGTVRGQSEGKIILGQSAAFSGPAGGRGATAGRRQADPRFLDLRPGSHR